MANGDVRKINEGRIAIQVDDMSYVIDMKPGEDQVEVVAAFMAKWKEKRARDKKMIAANEARRRKDAAAKAKELGEELFDLTDEDIEDLNTPKKVIKFSFPGFEEPEKLPEPKKDANPKSDRSGNPVPGGREHVDSKLGNTASGTK